MYFKTPFKKRWVSVGKFQFYWPSWWRLWPHFSAEEFVEDYGMPEYAGMYPHYLAWTFCFGPLQWMGYADA